MLIAFSEFCHPGLHGRQQIAMNELGQVQDRCLAGTDKGKEFSLIQRSQLQAEVPVDLQTVPIVELP